MVTRLIGKVILRAGGGVVEAEALFDTGATKSFVDVSMAEKLGYIKYDRKEVLLAIKDIKAHVVGELTARVVIEGFELPLSHVFGVVEGPRPRKVPIEFEII